MWTEWKTWLFCLTRPPRGRRTVKGLWDGCRLATSITEIKRRPHRPQVATQQKSVTGVNLRVLLYRYIERRPGVSAPWRCAFIPGMRRCAANAMEFRLVDRAPADPGFASARTPRAPMSSAVAQPSARFGGTASVATVLCGIDGSREERCRRPSPARLQRCRRRMVGREGSGRAACEPQVLARSNAACASTRSVASDRRTSFQSLREERGR
jgi:hypothetical protein